MLISGDLYKLGRDEVLRHCVLEHECKDIMEESHGGIVGGYYSSDATTQKIILADYGGRHCINTANSIVRYVTIVNA